MDSSQRVYWVDIAKFMAIIAVIANHTEGLLYKNPMIAWFSYYSVSLFILMMGVTVYWSYSRYKGLMLKKVVKDCLRILRPYLVATFVYEIVLDKQFSFVTFLDQSLHFYGSGPFYYVLLYLQLLLVAPLIHALLEYTGTQKNGFTTEILGLAIVIVISWFTTNRSDILNVYGGGGKLFGGTYLILLYLGMMFGSHYEKIKLNKKVSIVAFIICAAATIMWAFFISVDKSRIDSYLPFGEGFNPPSLSLGLYAILVACTVYLSEKALCDNEHIKKIYEKVSPIGKHTLYIFLYHRLFLDYFIPTFQNRTGIYLTNIWIMRLVYLPCMIGGPILIEIAFRRSYAMIRKVYLNRNV